MANAQSGPRDRGLGTIEEIVEKVIELKGFSEWQQEIAHGDGPTSELEYPLGVGP